MTRKRSPGDWLFTTALGCLIAYGSSYIAFRDTDLGVRAALWVIVWNTIAEVIQRICSPRNSRPQGLGEPLAVVLERLVPCPVTKTVRRTFKWDGDPTLAAWINENDLALMPWPVVLCTSEISPRLIKIRRTDVPGHRYFLWRWVLYKVRNLHKWMERRIILTLCIWGAATCVEGEDPNWQWLKKR
jgi:hypothetical protein